MVIYKFRNLKTGQATPIPPGEFTVGREDSAYVHVDDTSASRKHAKISNLQDGLFLEDLGSANGTAASGTLLTGRAKINYGDVIHIGSVPFRVDPEVPGEVSTAPAPGMRPVNRTYLNRDTERLPVSGSGELPRVLENLPPEKPAVPLVNPATDADAEELNAIIMRAPDPATSSKRLPTVRAGSTPLPVPTPQSMAPTKPQPEPAQSRPASVPIPHPSTVTKPPQEKISPAPAEAPAPTSPEAPPAGVNWGWLAMTFLAGLGAGLLIGLYFAKLFIDLGGKAVSLP